MLCRLTLSSLLTLTFLDPLRVQAEDSVNVSLFPHHHLIPYFTASGNQHRFSATQNFENRTVMSSMGGVLTYGEISYRSYRMQISTGASVYALLNPPEKVNLISADFSVDFFFVDISFDDKFFVRVGPGHTSHHLSDNAYEAYRYAESFQYMKDYWQAFAMYPVEQLRGYLYGGVQYSYIIIIDKIIQKPWTVELGFEGLTAPVAKYVTAYAAADVKFRQELEFGTTQNYQIGLKSTEFDGFVIRIAYNYKTGFDERGQFYNKKISWHTIGIYFDI